MSMLQYSQASLCNVGNNTDRGNNTLRTPPLKRRRQFRVLTLSPLPLVLSSIYLANHHGTTVPVQAFTAPLITDTRHHRSTNLNSRLSHRQSSRTTTNLLQQGMSSLFTTKTESVPGTSTNSRADPFRMTAHQQREQQQQLFPQPFSNTMAQNREEYEMIAMSALGLVFITGVIFSLASNYEPERAATQLYFIKDIAASGVAEGQDVRELLQAGGVELMEDSVEELEVVTRNIMAVAIPQSANDVFAVTLGEGVAGLTGILATFGVRWLLRVREVVESSVSTSSLTDAVGGGGSGTEDITTEAVANGDYFFTRAAVLPLLEAVGVPGFAASLGTVLIATLPYELVKGISRQRTDLQNEDRLMQMLLEEEQELKKSKRGLSSLINFQTIDNKKSEQTVTGPTTAVSDALVEETTQLDFIEIITDVTKWLEYDVLKNDLGGIIQINGSAISPGLESALFGFLAAFSSKLYSDVFYIYTDNGRQVKRNEARSRTLSEWTRTYASTCLSNAALFGVYEFVREPVKNGILTLLSGGADGCAGSIDLDLCLETFVNNNPLDETNEAQIGALMGVVASYVDRFQLEFNLDQGIEGFSRGLFVQLFSLYGQIMHIFN